jgi:ubiquinone/menaquinone biosynthesis C-methylase UbiE
VTPQGGAARRRWFFDAWSYVYDIALVQRALYRPEQDAVIAALPASTCRTVLDVGCGTGQLGHRLRAELPRTRVVGCDFSRGMLRQAAARDRTVGWVQGDATRLPFHGGSFDAVVSTQAFHWFPDQVGALREFARVLRPGGWLLVTVVSPPLAFLSQAIAVGSRLVGEPFYWPTTRDMRRMLAAAGLRLERQRRVFRLPGAVLLPPVLTVARRRGRVS